MHTYQPEPPARERLEAKFTRWRCGLVFPAKGSEHGIVQLGNMCLAGANVTIVTANTPTHDSPRTIHDGTVFSDIPTRVLATGLLNWVAGGWVTPLKQQVIQQYIDTAIQRGEYLKPGDEVLIQVNKMGVIQSRIQ